MKGVRERASERASEEGSEEGSEGARERGSEEGRERGSEGVWAHAVTIHSGDGASRHCREYGPHRRPAHGCLRKGGVDMNSIRLGRAAEAYRAGLRYCKGARS